MSRIICIADTKVKATRKSPRPSAPFGQGILASRPFAGRMPFTTADLAEAALMFADDATTTADTDWDALALEAEEKARYESQAATVFGHCLNCSLPCDDLTAQGLCDRCDDAATDASIASKNASYGLGFVVH